MEIRFATKEMIPQIKEIWHRCFGDEEDYMEFYFTHRFTEENMLVCTEDKKPVAMTTFLKAYLVTGEGEIPVHYAYAVATLPEYRGRGYAKMLLEKGKQHFQTPIVLEPASESLIYYYEKLGFRMAFCVAERTILPDEIAEAKGEEKGQQKYWLLTVTPDEYVNLRDAFLRKMVISAGIRMQLLMRCWKMTMQMVMLIKCSTMAERIFYYSGKRKMQSKYWKQLYQSRICWRY